MQHLALSDVADCMLYYNNDGSFFNLSFSKLSYISDVDELLFPQLLLQAEKTVDPLKLSHKKSRNHFQDCHFYLKLHTESAFGNLSWKMVPHFLDRFVNDKGYRGVQVWLLPFNSSFNISFFQCKHSCIYSERSSTSCREWRQHCTS